MKNIFNNQRRQKAAISAFSINALHLRNPWVAAWWSAAFPGFGHMFIGNYIKGYIFTIWEFYVNIKSNLNTAIIYSFTGHFDKAKAVLDTRWLLLYTAVYVYAIWDSYRSTVDLNKLAALADKNHPHISPFAINSFEINYLDKRNPWVAAVWSAFTPGLGTLYSLRTITGFYALSLWIITAYFSHIFQAIYYTAIGAFEQAAAAADPEWLLFMPSIYCYGIYGSYVHTVEYNKLFKLEQSRFLKESYQNRDFDMPV
ncbi:MAG: hypothetical protein HPY89_12465 [Pelotomaculum sp.]|nr:hypothetical protein [Pelotomaculum sp.]